jgi:hypothetical protein
LRSNWAKAERYDSEQRVNWSGYNITKQVSRAIWLYLKGICLQLLSFQGDVHGGRKRKARRAVVQHRDLRVRFKFVEYLSWLKPFCRCLYRFCCWFICIFLNTLMRTNQSMTTAFLIPERVDFAIARRLWRTLVIFSWAG